MTAMHLARDPAASTALLRRINNFENHPKDPLGLHRLWGTTWTHEMHEVVVYFAVGLVAFHVAMLGIASGSTIDTDVGAG